jgi:hypothetical protein
LRYTFLYWEQPENTLALHVRAVDVCLDTHPRLVVYTFAPDVDQRLEQTCTQHRSVHQLAFFSNWAGGRRKNKLGSSFLSRFFFIKKNEHRQQVGSKKIMADHAVCTDSKCFQVECAHVRTRRTDSVCVHVHSKHVQTANVFSGCSQYYYLLLFIYLQLLLRSSTRKRHSALSAPSTTR